MSRLKYIFVKNIVQKYLPLIQLLVHFRYQGTFVGINSVVDQHRSQPSV